MKFQAFEQAVTAKTVVQVTDLSGKRTPGEPGLNTPEAAEVSKLIAAQTEDSIKALAQIPGGGLPRLEFPETTSNSLRGLARATDGVWIPSRNRRAHAMSCGPGLWFRPR